MHTINGSCREQHPFVVADRVMAWVIGALAATAIRHRTAVGIVARPALRATPSFMQTADGEPPTEPDELQTQADGSTNYPWYLPKKEKTAWKPGEEPGMTSVIDAFNQGRNFNKNLDRERGREPSDQMDLSTQVFTLVLLLLAVWIAQVAWTQSSAYR